LPFLSAGATGLLPRRLLLAMPALLAAGISPPPAVAVPPSLVFTARRDGVPFGIHRVRFRTEGRETVAEIEIDLEVRVVGVRVFRYAHRNIERWRDGRLLSLDSTTDDNGTPRRLEVRAEGSGLRLRGSDFEGVLPPESAPTSYWNRQAIRRPKFDAQGGKPLRLNVSAPTPDTWAGRPAERLDVSGDLVLSLWYEGPVWRGLRFRARGATVTYEPA
jgi:hypothetical protein